MSLKNTSKFMHMVYSYLGYKKIVASPEMDKLILECLKEVEELSQFKYIYQEFDYRLDFLVGNKVYERFLKNCSSYYLVLTTLGKRVDDKCRYYSLINLEKMVVFDAVSSAYLEFKADLYEEENLVKPHTYRFCPGYQGTSTSDIREIFKYLDNKKIGVSIMDSNLMVPLKTMCGIVGIGGSAKKECGNCNVSSKCEYRKEGRTCY